MTERNFKGAIIDTDYDDPGIIGGLCPRNCLMPDYQKLAQQKEKIKKRLKHRFENYDLSDLAIISMQNELKNQS